MRTSIIFKITQGHNRPLYLSWLAVFLERQVHKMERNKKVNRINIYLSYQDKQVLNEIRDKYHLSYSTIINIIFNHIAVGHLPLWMDHYYYEDDKSTKTSVKPRAMTEDSYYKQLPMTMILTNVIKAFTRKEIQKLTGWKDKDIQKKNSQIYNEFQNTYDPNWNGNEWQRRMPRLIKQNKDYYKKLLESEDR